MECGQATLGPTQPNFCSLCSAPMTLNAAKKLLAKQKAKTVPVRDREEEEEDDEFEEDDDIPTELRNLDERKLGIDVEGLEIGRETIGDVASDAPPQSRAKKNVKINQKAFLEEFKQEAGGNQKKKK